MPQTIYLALRQRSPLVMLAGTAAFGWLFGRFVLLADGVNRLPLSADLPFVGAVALLWAASVFALLHPPREVFATVSRTTDDVPLVVGSLGQNMRLVNAVSVPFAGILASLFVVPVLLPADPNLNDAAPPGPAIVALLLAFASVVAAIWMISRTFLHGVELTQSHLVAHGFFRTRKYERDDVVRAADERTSPLVFGAFTLLRMWFPRTVQLTLRDGTQRTLLASSGSDIHYGTEVIDAWIAGQRPRA